MTIIVLAWQLDLGTPSLAGILIGAGVILGGVWWWEKRRFRLPEITVWDAAVTREFLEEHRYMEGFYGRRLDVLSRLVGRLPARRKAKLDEATGDIGERLEDYRDAIEENEECEVISSANRWTIESRAAALEEPLQGLAHRVNQWYRKNSRHEKLKGRAKGVKVVLARLPLIRDYFRWRRMLVYLAERSQDVPPRQMVSFRLAERGSSLHQRANGFFRMVRMPEAAPRAVRRSHRLFERKLVRFAKAVMEARVVGGERTLTLQDAKPRRRHDALAHLLPKAPEGKEIVLSEYGSSSLVDLWERFDRVSAPGLSHYEGYLDFVVFEEEVPGASRSELESALKKRLRIRVLDKVTDEWEQVDFDVHFGRYLVFKADWLARARELELRMSSRQKEKAKCFMLRTVEHRTVSIHPKKPD